MSGLPRPQCSTKSVQTFGEGVFLGCLFGLGRAWEKEGEGRGEEAQAPPLRCLV